MGSKERVDYKKVILTTIGFAGLMATALIAPNIVQVFPRLGLMGRDKHDRKYYFGKAVANLEKRGLVKLVKNRDGVMCVRLTAKGAEELKHYEFKEKVLSQQRKPWDGKYRLVVFDIKEWKRGARDEIRNWLEELGLVRLQNSVWVHPYDCAEVVALLKAKFKLGREVLHIVAESIENDAWLRRHFKL